MATFRVFILVLFGSEWWRQEGVGSGTEGR